MGLKGVNKGLVNALSQKAKLGMTEEEVDDAERELRIDLMNIIHEMDKEVAAKKMTPEEYVLTRVGIEITYESLIDQLKDKYGKRKD